MRTVCCVRALGVFLLSLCAVCSAPLEAARIINGTPVPAGTMTHIIRLRGGGGGKVGGACVGTVVGPRALITSAHCAKNGSELTFTVGKNTYTGKVTTSPKYPAADHDLGLCVTTADIEGATPAVIAPKNKAAVGLSLSLFGYGSTQVQGGGGNDGVLRTGETVITELSNFDMVSKKPGGAAVGFGDSGGPAFYTENGKMVLLGVNSKGNIVDQNWTTRLDLDDSQKFLADMAQANGIVICGINSPCDGTPPSPTPAPIPVPTPDAGRPTCTLTPSPTNVKLGDMLTLSLVSQGATAATIDGTNVNVPTGQVSIKATAAGTFTSRGTVTGPGGTGTCEGTFRVDPEAAPVPTPDRPTCTLTATPHEVKANENITLELVTQGQATYASIDSTGVSFPAGKKIIVAKSKGDFSAIGFVKGPHGSSNCFADYHVSDDGATPVTPVPNFAIVPTYCGENTLIESKVATVCIGVVKKDATTLDLKLSQVVVITYADSTKEILPILSRRTRPANEGDTLVKEELTLYANGMVSAPDYVVMDTRSAVLTKMTPTAGAGDVPSAIEGRTAKGKYFLVETMKAY